MPLFDPDTISVQAQQEQVSVLRETLGSQLLEIIRLTAENQALRALMKETHDDSERPRQSIVPPSTPTG